MSEANPVRNAYLPAENEAWAQLRPTPEDFIHDSFQSKEIEDGIREITGEIKATGERATAAYCFASPKFDAASATAWLAKKQIKFDKLDPAKDETYRQITASGVALSGQTFRLKAEAAGILPKLDILVYTGGLVQPEGWDIPIVVDLAGLQISKAQTPVLFNHDPDQVVGHGVASNSGKNLRLKGVVSAVGPAARQVVEAAKNGFHWQSSIGCDRIGAPRLIKQGDSIQCNGQSFAGPCYYWPSSILKEVTITGRGADPNSVVNLAAKARRLAASSQGVRKMDEQFESWVKALGLNPETLEETQRTTLQEAYGALHAEAPKPDTDEGGKEEVEKKMAARMRKTFAVETQRLDTIQKGHNAIVSAWCLNQPEHIDKRKAADALRAKAADSDWSVEKCKLEFMLLGRPEGVISNTRGNTSGVNSAVLECAAARSCMMSEDTLKLSYDPQTLEASMHPGLRGIGLKGLLFQTARAKGYSGDWIQTEDDCVEALKCAFPSPSALRAEASTFQLPGIFSNLMNKYLYQGFWEVESVWKDIAVSRPVQDFKPNPSFRLFGNLNYEKIGANGTIPDGDLGEIVYSNSADTYAKGYTTTRQAIINDDLSALSRIPQLFGRGAALTLNYVFWKVFLTGLDSQGATMFSAGRKNLLTGASSVLSSAALTLAEKTFNEQVGPDGQPLAMNADILLVPPALKNVASRLFTSDKLYEAVTGLASTSSKSTELVPGDNPHVNLYRPVMSRYLGAAIGPNSLGSDTAWYLLGAPGTVSYAEIVFLNGQQTPTIQSNDLLGNSLGIYHRAFFDFGVALTEYRNALKSNGA